MYTFFYDSPKSFECKKETLSLSVFIQQINNNNQVAKKYTTLKKKNILRPHPHRNRYILNTFIWFPSTCVYSSFIALYTRTHNKHLFFNDNPNSPYIEFTIFRLTKVQYIHIKVVEPKSCVMQWRWQCLYSRDLEAQIRARAYAHSLAKLYPYWTKMKMHHKNYFNRSAMSTWVFFFFVFLIYVLFELIFQKAEINMHTHIYDTNKLVASTKI